VIPTASGADKTPEQIEREMELTRESLTEKVAALEHQVVGTVQTAADTISETVEAVKSFVNQAPAAVSDSVHHAAEAVGESMREVFDITGHVRRHPWVAVGSAALLGCMASWLLTGRRQPLGTPAGYTPTPEPLAAAPAAPRSAERAPGLLDELWGFIGAQGKELATTALESVSAAVKQAIQENAPKLVNEAASRITGEGDPADPTLAGRFDARRTRA
jgi:ElaB/YqjD/DUF883 family membrane-anchored ribosome-binding protein